MFKYYLRNMWCLNVLWWINQGSAMTLIRFPVFTCGVSHLFPMFRLSHVWMERVERLLLCVSVSAAVSCTAHLGQRWAALHWSTETEPTLQTWQLHRWSLSNTTVLYWLISDHLFTPQTRQEDHAYNIQCTTCTLKSEICMTQE